MVRVKGESCIFENVSLVTQMSVDSYVVPSRFSCNGAFIEVGDKRPIFVNDKMQLGHGVSESPSTVLVQLLL